MAKKFLTSIDLNHNELQYAVVHALATAPGTGSTGQIYFNTSDNYLYQYYNNAWHAVGVPTPQNAYALDNGSVSSNSVPIYLYENGTIKNTINIKGAGGATITASNGTITITTPEGVVIDSALSTTSENAVQNKVITNSLNTKAIGNGRIFYGTCSTLGVEPTKEVTCSAYNALSVGDIVVVHFENSNICTSYSSLKLNVNSTGAKSIKQIQNALLVAPTRQGTVNGTRIFVYDGTNWIIQSDDNATYSTGTTSDIETGTSTVDKVWTPKTLHDYVSTVVGGVDAMRFKGTVNSNSDLPTTGVKVGDTYMVNTAGTYAGQTCEVGDLIIATATTPTWTVAQTNIDGAITSLSGTAPISVSGSGSSRTIAIAAASGSAAGSMSSAHYTKLEGIAAGAEVNVQSNWTQTNSSADDYIKNKPAILKQVSTTITAGQTSASINSAYNVYSYKAEMSNSEVVVDFSSTNNTWSITTSQSSAITITAVVNG